VAEKGTQCPSGTEVQYRSDIVNKNSTWTTFVSGCSNVNCRSCSTGHVKLCDYTQALGLLDINFESSMQ